MKSFIICAILVIGIIVIGHLMGENLINVLPEIMGGK